MLSGNRYHDTTAFRRVALAQAGLAPLVALLGAAMAGLDAGLALLYGGFVALAVSLVLAWRERQARRHPEWDQHRLLKQFIRTGVERLLVLMGLLGLGLAVLHLAPLPMLLGLVVAQLAWLAAAWGR
jgi:ATP synthase protein I